jgi:Holliday junction resolvase
VSYPRRAQLRYTVWSWAAYAGGAFALVGAAVQARSSAASAALMLCAAAALFGSGLAWSRRAARYRAGAGSERLVAERLRTLEQRGWIVRHSVVWRGRGDIDHVVEAPGGLAFAIETKTTRYEREHLARNRVAALQVDPRGRSCVPVICLARPRGRSRRCPPARQG